MVSAAAAILRCSASERGGTAEFASRLIGKREVSPTGVLEHFLGRIAEHDHKLQSFRHLDEAQARETAKRADKAVLEGDPLGPLHGIPMSAKEEVPIKGMPKPSISTGAR